MIVAEFDFSGLDRALAELHARVQARASEGLAATCEAIAARARQTTTFNDVTDLLRNSIQEAGVESSGNDLIGIVGFAAHSSKGFPYGLALEFGTHAGARGKAGERTLRAQSKRGFTGPKQRAGIKERRFIRDAIDAQDGSLLEAALGAALRDAGFGVRRT